jgi:hypothetical protein
VNPDQPPERALLMNAPGPVVRTSPGKLTHRPTISPGPRTAGVVTALVLVALASGCGSQDDQPRGAEDKDSSTSSTSTTEQPATDQPAEVPPLVGKWERTQTCAELVGVLRDNGMESSILSSLAGDGWIPDVTKTGQIEDPGHPCENAVSRKHSHFFTAAGEFGSLDAEGEQVDHGRYSLRGKDTLIVGGVTFKYRITDNDTISFTPRIPACRPDCWEAIWSVSVAFPGYTWHRVG